MKLLQEHSEERTTTAVIDNAVARDDRFIRYVTAAFSCALLLVSALSLSNYSILHYAFRVHALIDGVDTATERQRSLSQRVALLTMSYVDAHTPAVRERVRNELTKVLEEIEENHAWLLRNYSEAGKTPLSKIAKSIYFEEPYLIDEKLSRFLSHAYALAKTEAGTVTLDDPHLLELTRLSTELLEGFKRLVDLSRLESKRGISWIMTIMLVLLILTLLVLVFSVLFIFRPMVARIRRELQIRAIAEAQLASSEERYRLVTENSADSILAVDHDAQILFANTAVKEMFGLELEEVYRQPITQLFQTDLTARELLRYIQDRFSVGEPSELLGKQKVRTLVPLAVTIGASSHLQEPWFVLTVRDITQRKEAERQAEAYKRQIVKYNQDLMVSNRDLEEFASVISHDLKAPLHQVGAYVELIQNRHGAALPLEVAEFLGYVREGVARSKALIVNLLDVCRVSTSGSSLEHVELSEVLQDVLDDLKFQSEEAGAEFSLEPLGAIEADRSQMYQLFQNLLQNALKYRRPDTPAKIKITAEDLFDHDGFSSVRIQVIDNGRGLPSYTQPHLFRMFYRGDGVENVEGTGVGLSICKKIIDRHHGTITASSCEGIGAVFTVELPRQRYSV
jgi:PAS domain S-box-containing protein